MCLLNYSLGSYLSIFCIAVEISFQNFLQIYDPIVLSRETKTMAVDEVHQVFIEKREYHHNRSDQDEARTSIVTDFKNPRMSLVWILSPTYFSNRLEQTIDRKKECLL